MILTKRALSCLKWLDSNSYANKVLVVCGDDRRAKLVSSTLRDGLFETHICWPAEEAVQFVKDNDHFRIIIVEEGAFEALQSLWLHDRSIRIIVMIDGSVDTLNKGLHGAMLLQKGAARIISNLTGLVGVVKEKQLALELMATNMRQVLVNGMYESIVCIMTRFRQDPASALSGIREIFLTISDAPLHLYGLCPNGHQLRCETGLEPALIDVGIFDVLEGLKLTPDDLKHWIPGVGVIFAKSAWGTKPTPTHHLIFSELGSRLSVLFVLLAPKDCRVLGSLNDRVETLIHDLHEPIRSLAFLTEKIVQELPADHNCGITIQEIETNIATVFEMLAGTQSQIHGIAIPATSASNVSIIEAAVAAVRAKLERSGCRLLIRCDDLLQIDAQRTKLVNILQNLLSNAVKATIHSADGVDHVIVVHAFTADHLAIFEVTNPGLVIAPEIEAKLFTPFFTTEPDPSYHGIGLTQARSLLEGFGGSISYRRSLNRNIFSISVPIAAAPTTPTIHQ